MDSLPKKPSSSHVQSVHRAMLLLELLACENREMPLSDIARKMGWPKSTVHGLLATLRDFHMVDQSPINGTYRLGVRLFELGSMVEHSWDVCELAIPFMQKLNLELGEMIQLATQDKNEVLYLKKVDSTHMMRIVSEVGARMPMHCTALGKVLLAYGSHAQAKRILTKQGMSSLTPRTITNQDAMLRQLGQVRRQGYAVDDGECMESLFCVAAPVWNRDNQVKYSVSVSCIAGTVHSERADKIVSAVKCASENISYAMGHRPETLLVSKDEKIL